MDSLILHSFRRCPFAIRVRMVLEEKQISYELREEKLSQLSSELLSLHPEGRVPLLIHQQGIPGEPGSQKQVIYQSTIITEYLDEAFPEVPLMPTDPMDRAQVRLWTYWCDHLFKPDLDLFKYDQSTLSDSEAELLRARLHGHLAYWDSTLQSGSFLLGAKLGMTLADIHLFPFARQFMGIQPALPGIEKYKNLAVWLSMMISRPAFVRVMAK